MTPPTRAPVDGPRDDDAEDVEEGPVPLVEVALSVDVLLVAFEPPDEVASASSIWDRTGVVTSTLHRQNGVAALAPVATISSVWFLSSSCVNTTSHWRYACGLVLSGIGLGGRTRVAWPSWVAETAGTLFAG